MISFILPTPTHFPGIHAVARNGERLGYWKVEYVIDAPKGSDLNIFGAWDDSYSRLLRMISGKKARLVGSSLGQMEMSGIELKWLDYDFKLLEKGVLDYLFFGSKDLYELHKDNEKVHWFLYPIFLGENTNLPKDQSTKIPNSIGIFLPKHFRKNWSNQKAAYELAKRKIPDLQVFTNEVGWLPEKEYHELLSKMKLVLHVTHAESFGYAAIEAVQHGTLPIISPCVADNLWLNSLKTEDIVISNPDSPREIAGRIVTLLKADWYEELLRECQGTIQQLAEYNNAALGKLLKELQGAP